MSHEGEKDIINICCSFSGIIAERVDLRIFLTLGMVGSGLLTIAFGMAYYWKIHDISYFLMVQVDCMQQTTFDS